MKSPKTMGRATRRGNAGPGYVPTDEKPKHNGPVIADELAALRCCGIASANHAVRSFRETLADLAIIARTDPQHREWLARTLAPAIAACATPDEDACVQATAIAYANADSRTNPLLVKALSTNAAADWQALFASIRLERARGAELEGLVAARVLGGGS